MYSVRFFQRLVFLVGAAFLLTITPTSAKEVSKDKIVRALKGGNEAVRAQALDYLKEKGDDQVTSAVLIKILDLDVKRRGTRDSTLADDKYFTIIADNAGMTPFSRGLVKATAANRDRAVKWVMYLTWARGTNSYGALGTAFSVDPNTETIMFLSDGKPTRGKIIEQRAILAAIKKENAVRKMLINTIGIYTGGERNEKFIGFMKDLAKQNTGVYREVK